MRKPALVRAIFSELRASLGADVAASDVLKLANLILRAYRDDEQPSGDRSPPPNRAFVSLPVDHAMSDGGWRVLDFETMRASSPDEASADALATARFLIEKYLGPSWRYQ